MAKERDDSDVPSRLHDGWAYVVSLEGGERRYMHSSLSLAQLRALHERAVKDGEPFLDFDGARFDPEVGPSCAGYVVTSRVLAVGYADPLVALEIDAALQRQAQMLAEEDGEVAEDEEAKPTVADEGSARLR